MLHQLGKNFEHYMDTLSQEGPIHSIHRILCHQEMLLNVVTRSNLKSTCFPFAASLYAFFAVPSLSIHQDCSGAIKTFTRRFFLRMLAGCATLLHTQSRAHTTCNDHFHTHNYIHSSVNPPSLYHCASLLK